MSRKAALFTLTALACAVPAMAQPLPEIAPVSPTDTASALPKGWNKSASFMEIFVRSYKDSDGDGVGDIKGLTSKLDYLKDLGVTGLWLMPMGPSEDRDHGYAQMDYRAINPEFGTLADFDELVREAHKRGIGIILDWVVNHSASTDPLFLDAASSEKSRFRDWYLFSKTDPKWKVHGYFPWRKNPKGEGWYYAVFSPEMPDWNLRNPAVTDYLESSMRFWMNRGVDGFRLDAVTMLFEDGPKSTFNNPQNPKFTAELAGVVDGYDNRFMVCEASEGADMYAQSCGSTFAFGSQQEIRKSVLAGKLSAGLVAQLKSPLRALEPLTLQTHDSYVGDRLIDQYGVNGLDNYIAAAATALLGSDVSFSYYGEEIGESNNGKFNDPGLRGPMSWTADQHTAGFTSGAESGREPEGRPRSQRPAAPGPQLRERRPGRVLVGLRQSDHALQGRVPAQRQLVRLAGRLRPGPRGHARAARDPAGRDQAGQAQLLALRGHRAALRERCQGHPRGAAAGRRRRHRPRHPGHVLQPGRRGWLRAAFPRPHRLRRPSRPGSPGGPAGGLPHHQLRARRLLAGGGALSGAGGPG